VAELLEAIASDAGLTIEAVRDRCVSLHRRAVELTAEPNHAHFQIVHVLGWFLYGILHSLECLCEPTSENLPDGSARRAIAHLTAFTFKDFGSDLQACLRFLHKQCQALIVKSEDLASPDLLDRLRDEAWTRVKIFLHGLVLDFRGVDTAIARDMIGWNYQPVEEARKEIRQFKSFIERQASKDVFVAGKAQENIARALLQAFLRSRSYREVRVRGGQTDVLIFRKDGRFLYEAKIWRGKSYFEQGLRELEEYIEGENDDDGLDGVFYVIFDPTPSHSAIKMLGADTLQQNLLSVAVDIVVVNLCLPQPSKKRKA
jgi:hypothetical protein